MRRVVLVLATVALAILLACGVAQAIINGEPDRGSNAHPYVGAYVAKEAGKLRPVCSGTLISPKVFLTAGHCTKVEIEKDRPAYVSFDPTYKTGSSRLVGRVERDVDWQVPFYVEFRAMPCGKEDFGRD